MEDYQYMNGTGRSGARFQSWGTPSYGYQATDAWNSSGSALQYGGIGEVPRDHVCRPVIVDSDGRAMQAVLECPPRYDNHNYTDGYGANGFSSAGGKARWDYGGDSYGFVKRTKSKNFLDHVQNATMSEYGLGVPAGGFQRHKADYGSYDIGAAGGAYGVSANGWGKPSVGGGWGAPAASHGTPMEKATNYIIEAAAEALLDSGKPAGGGGGWESWNSSQSKKKKNGLVNSIGKEAAKKYAGQFIW